MSALRACDRALPLFPALTGGAITFRLFEANSQSAAHDVMQPDQANAPATVIDDGQNVDL